jgi:phosphate starvation-inducible PhoH-like protein
LVEKVITLENISLVDFLGAENQNIDKIANAFPKTKIVSRGNQIKISGNTQEITKFDEILDSLIAHYHKYYNISRENFDNLIENDTPELFLEED